MGRASLSRAPRVVKGDQAGLVVRQPSANGCRVSDGFLEEVMADSRVSARHFGISGERAPRGVPRWLSAVEAFDTAGATRLAERVAASMPQFKLSA